MGPSSHRFRTSYTSGPPASEFTSSVTMHWVRPCRRQSIHFSAVSDSPISCCPSGPTGCYDQACRRLLRDPRGPEKSHRHRPGSAGDHFVLSPTSSLYAVVTAVSRTRLLVQSMYCSYGSMIYWSTRQTRPSLYIHCKNKK